MRHARLLLVCLAALCLSVQCNAAKIAVYSAQPTFATAVSGRLASLGYETAAWSDAAMVTPENLNGANALMVLSGYAFLLSNQRDVIANYVAGGGALIVEQPNNVGNISILPPGLEIDVFDRAFTDMGVSLTPAGLTHPMTAALTAADLSGNMDTVRAQDISSAYSILAVRATDPTLVALAVARYGSGKVVFHTGNIHPYSVSPGSNAFVNAMVNWAITPEAPSELSVDVSVVPNRINLNSRGFVRVAVLSNPDFDAAVVDPAGVLVAGVSPEKSIAQDVNLDGCIDMVFVFSTESLGLTVDDTELELTGSLIDGQKIRGAGTIDVFSAGNPASGSHRVK